MLKKYDLLTLSHPSFNTASVTIATIMLPYREHMAASAIEPPNQIRGTKRQQSFSRIAIRQPWARGKTGNNPSSAAHQLPLSDLNVHGVAQQ